MQVAQISCKAYNNILAQSYDLGGRGSVGFAENCRKLASFSGLKSISSRLIGTGLLTQYSAAAEHLHE